MTHDGEAGTAQHIVIAGGGTAGWMAASLLARYRPRPRARITLIESEEIGAIGVGEATVPLLQQFNEALGIAIPDFVARTQATFKLGVDFRDWGEIGNRHFHGFGWFGTAMLGAPAHHHWLRLRANGPIAPLDEWSLPHAIAARCRFAPEQAVTVPEAVFHHAYHFDAALYAGLLREIAQATGVRRIEGRIRGARRDGESGNVAALVLDNGEAIDGDVFIDCTGFRSLLLGETLGVGFEDWSGWFPCDRALAIGTARVGDTLETATRATAHGAGWQWRIPLQHRTGNGLVYSSRHLSDDEAAALLLGQVEGELLHDPRSLRFKAGRRRVFWERNVVAIGLAAGFMEPLESTSIQLIQSAISRLVQLLPYEAASAAAVAEFNRVTTAEHERIRDFLIAHYCISRRSEPLWRKCASMRLPDTLTHKLALWDACGQIALYDQESHQEPSWVSIMIGQGRIPAQWHPAADTLAIAALRQLFMDRRARVAMIAEGMPHHHEFIARHCAADRSLPSSLSGLA